MATTRPDDDDKALRAALDELKQRSTPLSFLVVGSGHGGMAMAGYLGIKGHPVTLYNRTDNNLDGVRWHGGVKVSGAISGFGPVSRATAEMEEALEGVDIVMVVTPSTAHRELASLMAPHLRDGQIIVLNPGRTGGALEYRATIRAMSCAARVLVAETQTFLFASRAVTRHEALIYRIKDSVPLATLPAHWIPPTLSILNGVFPQFVAGSNVLATSLENIGAVFHPALTILNAGWIEATKGEFEYYLQGITPAIASLLEKIDQERVAVAAALGVRSVTAREWLYLSYGSSGSNLYEAIQHTVGYKGIKAPQTINHRYIFEDVPMSLVPIASLGAYLGKRTPTIDMVIDLANILHGTDYRARGRTVETLGLSGMSVKDINLFVAGHEAAPKRSGVKEKESGL